MTNPATPNPPPEALALTPAPLTPSPNPDPDLVLVLSAFRPLVHLRASRYAPDKAVASGTMSQILEAFVAKELLPSGHRVLIIAASDVPLPLPDEQTLSVEVSGVERTHQLWAPCDPHAHQPWAPCDPHAHQLRAPCDP